jgi:outer membrane assembly lipoprotein YfiO
VRIRPLLLIACLTVSPTLAAEPPQQVWEFRDGNWSTAVAADAQPASDDTLDAVDALLSRGQHREARKLALKWEKANRASPIRDRVLYQIAQAYFQYGDRHRSFFHLDELMDTYPQSRFFYPALELQYRIADEYLNGYKQRVFKTPAVRVTGEAIEMMYRIQQRSPGSPLAEKALLRTADFYFADANYELASDTYAAYARAYPRSPAVPRVRLRGAYSSLAQFRGLRYDATPLVDARTQFQTIVADYPDLAAEENLPDVLARIETTFARKGNVTGDFYRRTNAPNGAAYHYQHVATNFPGSPEATDATKALSALPEAARAAVSPATRPVDVPVGGLR